MHNRNFPLQHPNKLHMLFFSTTTLLPMFKNYLTIAFRTLQKHTGYTLINTAGLTIGMACCVLIFLLVKHEWSYDRFHTSGDDIYRTYVAYQSPGTTRYQAMMPPTFTPNLVATFPTIVHASRMVAGGIDLKLEHETFRKRLVEVDAPFFEMFSFPMLAGDPATALVDPSSMVITHSTAINFWGEESALSDHLGKIITITRDNVDYNFQVSGIVEDIPATSSLTFDAAISFENYDNLYLGGNNWGGRTSTYIQLPEGTDPEAFEATLPEFVNTEFAQYIQALKDNDFLTDAEDAFVMHLQPLYDMHLDPTVFVPYEAATHDPFYSYILSGIGLLVLLIACINFMTLSVGRSTSRAREVGMRKVLGAFRGQLLRQFWGEALIQSAFALFLGIALAWLILPSFNTLTGQALSFQTLSFGELFGTTLVLLLIVGVVAGGYPAVILSRFQPASVLKGAITGANKNRFTRSLVVIQYTISISLIVSTIIMTNQLQYMMEKDLGYNKESVVVVNTGQVSDEDAPLLIERFRNALLPYDDVLHVARSGSSFTRGSDRNTWTDADGNTRQAYNFGVDEHYVDLMGMEIVQGRNFSEDYPTDATQSVLVNQKLVDEFGLDDPVGKKLTNWLSFVYDESPTIIGVVKDFNFQSLRNEVQPAVMNMHPEYYNFMGAILIRVQGADQPGTLARIEETWNKALPGKPFTYSFLKDDLFSQYQVEDRWGNIVTYAALFAIFIACLGLFGLATLTVTKRTKEIGIRKVMGASSTAILGLVVKEFVILILISGVLAIPLAYYGMDQWLVTFAYRISIGSGAFILAILLALFIALITIGYHAYRAALSNPVVALRYE